MNLFQGSTFTEIASLIAIVGALVGGIVWLLRIWLMSIFVTKKAYYAQRSDDKEDSQEAETEFKQALLDEIKKLHSEFASFNKSITDWQGVIRERMAVLEDRQKR